MTDNDIGARLPGEGRRGAQALLLVVGGTGALMAVLALAADPFALNAGDERDLAATAVAVAVGLLAVAALATLAVLAPGLDEQGRLRPVSVRTYRVARITAAVAIGGTYLEPLVVIQGLGDGSPCVTARLSLPADEVIVVPG